jgi:dolichol-phosphate mannosyltransferase
MSPTRSRDTGGAPGSEDEVLELCVAMPVYNEEGVLNEVVSNLREQILDEVPDSALVMVDDASTDGTPEILARLSEHPQIHVHRSPVNRGHGPTVRSALEHANASWIFQIDSDGQFDTRDFWKLWERRHEAHLLMGVRADRKDPRHRLLLTAAVRVAISLLTFRRLRDPNVPFKLISREMWSDLRPFIGRSARVPSIMISMGAILRGWSIIEFPVTHLPRRYGASTLRLGRLLRFSLLALVDIVRFRTIVRRKTTTRIARNSSSVER